MREIELAALWKQDVVISEGRGCGSATINLATTKTDGAQKGAYRTLCCTCPTVPCPVKAAAALLQTAEERAEHEFLVRNLGGEPATKQEVEKELRALAQACGTAGRVTGHSMRVTGAQRLAYGGASIQRITLFGRWAGKLMLHYAREALLGPGGAFVSKALGAPALTVKAINTELYKRRGDLTQQQMQDFRHQVLGNPLERVTRETLEAKWAAFSAVTKRVGEEAGVQHPVGACRAGEGAVHEI